MNWLPRRCRFCAVLLLAVPGLAAAVMTAPEEDAEQEISIDELPDSIQQALRDVQVDEVEVSAVYEIDIKEEGVEIELRLTADGRLLGIQFERGNGNDDDEHENADTDAKHEGHSDEDQDHSKTVRMNSVPKAARAALKKFAGDSRIESVEREEQHGSVLFEAMWKVDGNKHEATVTADGVLVELEESVSAELVPGVVRRLCRKHFDNSDTLTFERKLIAAYEAEGLNGPDELEVLASSTGRLILFADDDDDHRRGKNP